MNVVKKWRWWIVGGMVALFVLWRVCFGGAPSSADDVLDYWVYLPLVTNGSEPVVVGPTSTPTATPAPATPTSTPTSTPTATPTSTNTPTSTPTSTNTPTATSTSTPEPTPTSTPTPNTVYIASSTMFINGQTGRQLFVGEAVNGTSDIVGFVTARITLYMEGGYVLLPLQTLTVPSVLLPGQRAPFQLYSAVPVAYDYYTATVTFRGPPEFVYAPPLATTVFVGYFESYSPFDEVWTYLYGEVRNDSDIDVASIVLSATYYDELGAVVDVKRNSTSALVVHPGELACFTIHNGTALQPHSYYTVQAISTPYTKQDRTPWLSLVNVRDEGNLTLLGSVVKQLGSRLDFTSIKVIGTIYDADGRVVSCAMCGTNPTSFIEPATIVNFELNITSPPPYEWHHYTLKVR